MSSSMLTTIYKQENAHDDSVWSCAWQSSARDNVEYVVSGGLDDMVKVWKWNRTQLEPHKTLEGHVLGVVSVDINSSGTLAASSSLDAHIRIWDLETGKQVTVIEGGCVDVWQVVFTADGRYVVTGGASGKLSMYEVETGRCERQVEARAGKFAMALAASMNGASLAVGAIDGIVTVYDAATGRLVSTLEGHTLPVRALAFSPDSQLLLTGADDGHVKVYDVRAAASGAVHTYAGHSSWVLSVAFSPDGTHFASSSSDKSVRVWNNAQRAQVAVSREHADQVWSVRWSPSRRDASLLLSASDDRSLRVHQALI